MKEKRAAKAALPYSDHARRDLSAAAEERDQASALNAVPTPGEAVAGLPVAPARPEAKREGEGAVEASAPDRASVQTAAPVALHGARVSNIRERAESR